MMAAYRWKSLLGFSSRYWLHDIKVEDARRSFNILDTDNDGEISREEFLTAAFDFMCGMKETEIANSLFGPLL